MSDEYRNSKDECVGILDSSDKQSPEMRGIEFTFVIIFTKCCITDDICTLLHMRIQGFLSVNREMVLQYFYCIYDWT